MRVDILRLIGSTGGTLTVAGGLVVLVTLLFRSLVAERRARSEDAKRWREERAEDTQRWRAEIARINADHDTEIAEMRAKITRLETREIEQSARFTAEVERLNTRLDAEMELRRRAQGGTT